MYVIRPNRPWRMEVATPADRPAAAYNIEGDRITVLDDGDGNPADYEWNGTVWIKMADPDWAGAGGVAVKDEGIDVPNTPHIALNFVGDGVAVTDAGGGVATITIGGSAGCSLVEQDLNAQIGDGDPAIFELTPPADADSGFVTLNGQVLKRDVIWEYVDATHFRIIDPDSVPSPITNDDVSFYYLSCGGGGGGGEANTASNVGTGIGVYKQKVGVDLQLHTIDAASGRATVALNGDVIEIDVVPAAVLADHVAAGDPHPGYQLESEKGAVGGYAALDGAGKVPAAQLPSHDLLDGSGTNTHAQIDSHLGDISANPHHVTYAQTGGEAAGTAAAMMGAHTGAGDPHTVYQLESEKGSAGGYASLDGVGKVPAAQLPPSGEINTASNVGSEGFGVYRQKIAANLEMRKLRAGASIVISQLPGGELEIAATGGGGGGEANTASNVGTAGVGIYRQKVGADLQFKKLNAGSSKVTITDDVANDEVDVDIDESQIDHDNIANHGTNTHSQIDAHIAAAHTHANKSELDLVTDGDHDVRTDNPHAVTAGQVGAAPASHTHVEADVTDLDHYGSADFDADFATKSHSNLADDEPEKHRLIDDLGTGTTDLWSADKIASEIGAAAHTHANKSELDLVTDGDHDVRTDNPHAVTAGQVGADPIGTAAGLIATHEGAPDPHPQYQLESEKGGAGGYASLDGSGKVPTSQLPDTVLGAMEYQGVWDCSGGAYPIGPEQGDYYVCSVAGVIGAVDYEVGDWLAYNGSTWDKLDNSDKVSSVNGAVGAVVITKGDLGLGNVPNLDTTDAVSKAHDRLHAIDSVADHSGIVGGATDNFMALDGNGLPKDSGSKASDFESAGAVSAHETAYDHADIPSGDEKDALQGTSGTPSDSNRYVTDDDPRLGSASAADLPTVQARRTTSASLTTSFADIAFDATDVENATSIVEHDDTHTERITVHETGLYDFGYTAIADFNNDATATLQVVKTTGVTPSTVPGSVKPTVDGNDENEVSAFGSIELSDGDYLALQGMTSATEVLLKEAVFWVRRARGTRGDDGADGAQGIPGSGSSITVQDEGIAIPNTPHTILDFTGDGVTVTDAGGGKALVTISGGGGGSSRTAFFQPDHDDVLGKYKTQRLSNGSNFEFNFVVPDDFVSLEELVFVFVPLANINSPIDPGDPDRAVLTSQYGAFGEAYNQHAETDTITAGYAGIQNQWSELDISSAYSNLAAGDYCGLNLHNDTNHDSYASIHVLGIKLKYASSGGGGASTVSIGSHEPNEAIFPATDPAGGAFRNTHPVLTFDDTTDESVIFVGRVPNAYGGGGLTVAIDWVAASATSGSAKWGIEFEKIAPDDLDIDTDGFAAQQDATSATNATCGKVTRTSISLTQAEADGIQPGDGYRLRVTRLNLGVSMAGDAQLLRVGVEG